jgi:Zn-dependent M28 family amino/carboxypeptidase
MLSAVARGLRAVGAAFVGLLLQAACRVAAPPIGDPIADAAGPPAAQVAFGDAAMQRMQTLMDLPRALGDDRRAASIDALADMLDDVGATRVDRYETTAPDPATGTNFALTTLVAHVRPEAAQRFVLATHFDTRPWADESTDPADHDRPIPGANDGTSGVAVLLEVAARLPARLPDDVGWTLILFDGEELGRPGQTGGYCVGSRDLARRLAQGADPALSRAQFGIVFDMVGDRDLSIPVEPGSAAIHPSLVRHVWATAAARGHGAFDATPRAVAITDDHRFLTDAGVPSILIIDRDYDAWHTLDDTIDQVSAQSLDAVGDTVLAALATWFR